MTTIKYHSQKNSTDFILGQNSLVFPIWYALLGKARKYVNSDFWELPCLIYGCLHECNLNIKIVLPWLWYNRGFVQKVTYQIVYSTHEN